MIGRQEVMDFARELTLAVEVVEKDYILGWLLAGISNHVSLQNDWVFKGGTCLKKCYFETYRFSEDLDFTLTNPDHLSEEFLLTVFGEVVEWIYEQSGIEIPGNRLRFDIYENNRGGISAEGRVYYRGPMQRRGDLARIKLDLTSDEVLVLEPAICPVHHPYSDNPAGGINVACYCFEEIFAEKVRALAERQRPRDLYDVIHLYRHDELQPDRSVVLSTLRSKCIFKGIPVPTRNSVSSTATRDELLAEWENMLAHQLPILPPFEQFWNELPQFFDWLHQVVEKTSLPSFQMREKVDESWRPPAMVQTWHSSTPMETIRYAAANRLCVNLRYRESTRLIEPYSLRRTEEGNILLYAVKHSTGEPRSYRIDRIQGAEITKTAFSPKYQIELTASGSPQIPSASERSASLYGKTASLGNPIKRVSRKLPGNDSGPRYVYECSSCGKKFTRKTNTTKLNPHKDKQGYPCPSRTGFYISTEF